MAFPFSQQIVAEHDGGGSSLMQTSRGRYKVAYDSVHKYIQLEDTVLSVMDTPEFQRLRDLKQLGTCYLVFPGASHNRFEHSLGVSHLSGTMIDHFRTAQPALGITDEEATLVRVAGLVHDLGHGPFSHVFDGQFIPSVRPPGAPRWHHEQMSAALLDVLLDDNEIDSLDSVYHPPDGDGQIPAALRGKGTSSVTGREVVKYMLHPNDPSEADTPESFEAYTSRLATAARRRERGTGSGGQREEALLYSNSREFLFEIVANAHTGIDTDKFDYLMRDSQNLGLLSAFDHRRVLFNARVMPTGHIAYHSRETMTINEMFHTRYTLFRTIYTHRATRSLETMICDALRHANTAWGGRLARSIDDPREYRTLTDAVLLDIQHSTSTVPDMVKAREIVNNIRRRRLYRFVDELLVHEDWRDKLRKITPEDISTHNSDPGIDLRPEDIIISDVRLGYGLGKEDPIARTHFWFPARRTLDGAANRFTSGGGGLGGGGCQYSHSSAGSGVSPATASAAEAVSSQFEYEWGPVQPSKVSHLLPRVFEERLLRVYTRETDKNSEMVRRKIWAIIRAFRSFLRSQGVPVSLNDPDPASRVYYPPPTTATVAGSSQAPLPYVSFSQELPLGSPRRLGPPHQRNGYGGGAGNGGRGEGAGGAGAEGRSQGSLEVDGALEEGGSVFLPGTGPTTAAVPGEGVASQQSRLFRSSAGRAPSAAGALGAPGSWGRSSAAAFEGDAGEGDGTLGIGAPPRAGGGGHAGAADGTAAEMGRFDPRSSGDGGGGGGGAAQAYDGRNAPTPEELGPEEHGAMGDFFSQGSTGAGGLRGAGGGAYGEDDNGDIILSQMGLPRPHGALPRGGVSLPRRPVHLGFSGASSLAIHGSDTATTSPMRLTVHRPALQHPGGGSSGGGVAGLPLPSPPPASSSSASSAAPLLSAAAAAATVQPSDRPAARGGLNARASAASPTPYDADVITAPPSGNGLPQLVQRSSVQPPASAAAASAALPPAPTAPVVRQGGGSAGGLSNNNTSSGATVTVSRAVSTGGGVSGSAATMQNWLASSQTQSQSQAPRTGPTSQAGTTAAAAGASTTGGSSPAGGRAPAEKHARPAAAVLTIAEKMRMAAEAAAGRAAASAAMTAMAVVLVEVEEGAPGAGEEEALPTLPGHHKKQRM